jgi:hypothetical protein
MNPEVQQPHIEFRKLVNGRSAARFTVSESDSASVEQLLREKGHEHRHHGNCRPVLILDINDEVYAERVRHHGARPIQERWFPSASALSIHLGLNRHAVSQALQLAKQRGADVTIVAGLTVGWADEVGGN